MSNLIKLEASCEFCLDSGWSPRYEGCSCERCGGRVRKLRAAQKVAAEKAEAEKKEIEDFWAEAKSHFFPNSL